MLTKVLILVPTYNECENIALQLLEINKWREILSNQYEISILNIDDSSPDGTAKIAKDLNLSNFNQIINPEKGGLGPAYLAGFNWGLLQNFDYFVEMDADRSHLPSQLPNLLAQSGASDLVIGTRWIAGGKIENWPWYRMLISRAGTRYAGLVLGLPYKDLTSGYRVLSRKFLEALDLNTISTKGYGFQIEIAFQAHENGFSIAQVPITFVERIGGESKMSLVIALEAFRYITKLGIKRGLNRIYRR